MYKFEFEEELTKEEAIASARKGDKITHSYFTPDEWFTIQGNMMTFEDGVRMFIEDFFSTRTGAEWREGYAVWKEKPQDA
jgi:hypothetical protein